MDQNALRNLLLQVCSRTEGIRSLLLVTDDGFPIVSTLDAGDEESRSTAVGAILTEAGERGLKEMDLGSLDVVVTIGSDGYLVQKRLAANATVLIVCNQEVMLGLTLARLRSVFPQLHEAYCGISK